MSFLKLPLGFSSALRGTLSRCSLAESIAQQLMRRFKKLVAQQILLNAVNDGNMSKTKDLKKCWRELDSIVPTIDKIGSGFEDTEKAALALFLYFKEEGVLDRLAYIRSIISIELEHILGTEEFNNFIEHEAKSWKPPYNKSRDELLAMISK